MSMIKFINDQFFEQDIQKMTNTEDGRTYYKNFITSSLEVEDKKTNEMKKRVVTTVYHNQEDYNQDNCMVRSTATKGGGVRVSISSNVRNRFDTNIYLVAIPFNGFLEKIEDTPQYRIYRGFVVSAKKRSIEWAGDLYKKIAYMIVVPNAGMMKEDARNHVDLIKLVMRSYNIETVEGEKDPITVKTTNTIEFYPDGHTNTLIETDNVDPVDPENFRGIPFFPIFRPKSNPRRESSPNHGGDIESMIENFNKKSLDRQPRYKNNSRKKNRR